MWNPPMALRPEEQKIVVRTQKARKFFVFRTSDSLQKMDIRAAHAENRLMAACL
jgi:hypothetical protein